MPFTRAAIILLAVMLQRLALAAAVDIQQDYKWIDLSLCKKPQQTLWPLPRESYRASKTKETMHAKTMGTPTTALDLNATADATGACRGVSSRRSV